MYQYLLAVRDRYIRYIALQIHADVFQGKLLTQNLQLDRVPLFRVNGHTCRCEKANGDRFLWFLLEGVDH